MTASNLKNTCVLNYWQISQIINNNQCTLLEKINLHDYEYIVGPHLINKNHWVAVIINVKHFLFSLIDPKKQQTELLDQHFQNWIQYYNTRYDKSGWSEMIVDHQTDNFNCGVFEMLFISSFIKTGRIEFSTQNILQLRCQIADTIKNYF